MGSGKAGLLRVRSPCVGALGQQLYFCHGCHTSSFFPNDIKLKFYPSKIFPIWYKLYDDYYYCWLEALVLSRVNHTYHTAHAQSCPYSLWSRMEPLTIASSFGISDISYHLSARSSYLVPPSLNESSRSTPVTRWNQLRHRQFGSESIAQLVYQCWLAVQISRHKLTYSPTRHSVSWYQIH